MELPQDLRMAIDEELAAARSKNIATLASDLSNRYRTGVTVKGGKFLQSKEDVAAYAAFRLPATYAAVFSALSQLYEQRPQWRPKTLLDVGAGPGTAMWAAANLWPELETITLLEREGDMIALGKRLAAYSDKTSVQQANWTRVDITETWETPPQDLIIASYSLGELPQESFKTLIHKLWKITKGTLVIIEPGTPIGSARIQQARELLLNQGAKTIAPCPHNHSCPIEGNDWCHFTQRVARSRLHRQVKAGELSYEDEKFSFLAMTHDHNTAIQGRVIRHPQIRKGHIQLQLCTPEGLSSTVVTRKDKELFRSTKDLHWGSVYRK